MRHEIPTEQPEATRDTIENRARFRVAFFGTGSDKSVHDTRAIEVGRRIATEIIRDGGHTVITGGYESGIMGAVSKAANQEAQALGRHDLMPEGVTLGEWAGKPSTEARTTARETLPERLHDLIDQSDAAVVLHGKIGTIVELVTALWSYTVERLKHGNDDGYVPKPIILADSSLEHAELISFLEKNSPEKITTAADSMFIVNMSDRTNGKQYDEAADIVFSIVERYYRQSIGETLTSEDKQLLDQYSLKNYLRNQKQFEAGAGI